MERLDKLRTHLIEKVPCSTNGHQGPLAGIRVLDMSSVISGPWASSILADQGADVLRVEAPGKADMTRSLGKSPGVRGMASMFVTANRSKRAISLDIKKAEGIAVLKRLVPSMDVVLQNYRPGVAERLGVDYKSLRVLHPGLVMLSISGYGSTGPLIDARVYDQVVQAMTGVGEVAKDAAGKPSLFHNLMFDKVTALYAAQSITAALVSRASRGGRGQHVELSMLDAAIHFLFPDAYWNRVWADDDVAPLPVEWRDIHAKSEYDAADGKVAMALPGARELLALVHMLRPLPSVDLLDAKRAAKDPLYLRQWRLQSTSHIREKLRGMTRQQIFDGCLVAGIPCGKFNTIDEVLLEPQVLHNKTVLELKSPVGGKIRNWRTPKSPASFEGTPVPTPSMAPVMGEHTDQVLREFGYTEEQIAALHSARVVT